MQLPSINQITVTCFYKLFQHLFFHFNSSIILYKLPIIRQFYLSKICSAKEIKIILCFFNADFLLILLENIYQCLQNYSTQFQLRGNTLHFLMKSVFYFVHLFEHLFLYNTNTRTQYKLIEENCLFRLQLRFYLQSHFRCVSV